MLELAIYGWILLTGGVLVALLKLEAQMEKFNAAVARLNAAADAIIAKLEAGNNGALEAAALELDKVSEKLEAKAV